MIAPYGYQFAGGHTSTRIVRCESDSRGAFALIAGAFPRVGTCRIPVRAQRVRSKIRTRWSNTSPTYWSSLKATTLTMWTAIVLLRGAIKGMLAELDPHSEYFTREELRDFNEDTQGKFGGVGVEVEVIDGKIIVIAPIEGGPAEKAGIQSGDQIIEIDGQKTLSMEFGSDCFAASQVRPSTSWSNAQPMAKQYVRRNQ